MKLESLKNDKFKAFKKDEIQNMINVFGGEPVATCLKGKDDCRDYATNSTGHTDGGGKPWDFYYRECELTQSF